MSRDQVPSERDLYYHAAECLDSAYREVDAAASALHGLAGHWFMQFINQAKSAIGHAKDEICA